MPALKDLFYEHIELCLNILIALTVLLTILVLVEKNFTRLRRAKNHMRIRALRKELLDEYKKKV